MLGQWQRAASFTRTLAQRPYNFVCPGWVARFCPQSLGAHITVFDIENICSVFAEPQVLEAMMLLPEEDRSFLHTCGTWGWAEYGEGLKPFKHEPV